MATLQTFAAKKGSVSGRVPHARLVAVRHAEETRHLVEDEANPQQGQGEQNGGPEQETRAVVRGPAPRPEIPDDGSQDQDDRRRQEPQQAEQREERARRAAEDEIKASTSRARREAMAAADASAPSWEPRSADESPVSGYRTF